LRVSIEQSPILPSNQSPLGALPARFRRQRLLIVGCGDVGLRVARALQGQPGEPVEWEKRATKSGSKQGGMRLLALTSSPARVPDLRQRGIMPILGNLDDPTSLRRLAGIATRIIHLAPPPGQGAGDPRSRALHAALRLRSLPASYVYASTSGVYGDCHGEIATETRAAYACSERAARRIDAENRVRHLGRVTGLTVSMLRIPGIYAPDREGGTPRARLLKGTPVLRAEDDVFTNHIHADDLARACLRAMWAGRPQRVYNINDDTQLKMADYFDLAADLYALPRPPRITRQQAHEQLSPVLMSFMSESRRMDNTRMKTELKLVLRYSTVATGLL
jgi:nucleoside-diphosphate-sugar epimerase